VQTLYNCNIFIIVSIRSDICTCHKNEYVSIHCVIFILLLEPIYCQVNTCSKSLLKSGLLIDRINVLCPTRHKIGNLGDVLPSQSLGLVLKY